MDVVVVVMAVDEEVTRKDDVYNGDISMVIGDVGCCDARVKDPREKNCSSQLQSL
jgi:hypothetical protein